MNKQINLKLGTSRAILAACSTDPIADSARNKQIRRRKVNGAHRQRSRAAGSRLGNNRCSSGRWFGGFLRR